MFKACAKAGEKVVMDKNWLMGYAAGVDDGSLGFTNMEKYKKGKQLQEEAKPK